MKTKQFVFFVALFIIAAFSPKTADASLKTLASSAPIKSVSATFASESYQPEVDNRVEILKSFLEQYESPLSGSAETFVEEADTYNLDWKLVAAIAGVESYFGHLIPYNSYNGWGWGVYGNNVTYFTSWDDGIKTISQELREKYIDRWGAKDVEGIGQYYAADPHWAAKVRTFMQKIDEFAADFERKKLSITI